MASRLIGAKPFTESMLRFCQFDPWEQTSVKFKSMYEVFIQENTSDNFVCGMAAILSRLQCVNSPLSLKGKDFNHQHPISVGKSMNILWMPPANQRRCYIATSSLIGWAYTQNDS